MRPTLELVPPLAVLAALAAGGARAQVLSFARHDHPLEIPPAALIAADVDADGVPDLCAVGPEAARVAVLSGAAGFEPAYVSGIGSEPSGLAAGDFDADGVTDLAVACTGNAVVSLLRGQRGGLPEASASYPVGPAPIQVVAADLDLDGDLDLATCHAEGNELSVLMGDGSGGFGPPVMHVIGPPALDRGFFPAPDTATSLRVADCQADGDADLVFTLWYDFETRALLNDGAGGFTLEEGGPLFAWVESFAVGDLDGDALPDLVGRGNDGLDLTTEYCRGLPSGAFDGAAWELANVHGHELADLDGDGELDDLFVNHFPKAFVARIGNGDLSFGSAQTFPILDYAHTLAAADLDLDGDVDAAVAVGGWLYDTAKVISVYLQVPPAPPTITATVPSAVPVLATGPQTLLIRGSGFTTLQSVELDGVAIAATFLDDSLIRVDLPSPVGSAGADLQLDVENAFGAVQTMVPLVPAEPTAFVEDPVFRTALDVYVAAGLTDLLFLAVSPSALPSSLPGVVELGIGNNFLSLFSLGTLAVPPSGWAHVPLVFGPLPDGITLYFQLAAFDLSAPAFPLETSNVAWATQG